MWTKPLWQINAPAQRKHILSTHFLCTRRSDKLFIYQANTTMCRDRLCRKRQTPAGQMLWLDAAVVIKGWEKRWFQLLSSLYLIVLRSVCQAIVCVASKLLARLKNLKCLWVDSQSFFCTFSWFFWTFWWTTFTVVRKFPRNKTRNVSASINTWKETKGTFLFQDELDKL